MKKLVFYLSICLLAYSVYYVYKHKNRFIYRFDNEETSLNDTIVKYQNEILNLKRQNRELQDFTDVLAIKIENNADTIYSLRKRLNNLTSNSESKPTEKQANSIHIYNANKKSTNKNEKSLPIARSADAIELKEFFTDRYSDR